MDTYRVTYNDNTTFEYTITNGEDGEVTQEQFDKLQTQVNTLKEITSQMPQVSDSGEEAYLADTIKAPFTEFEVKGHSEQETTEGYNIMNFDVPNQNSKVTVNNDGTITINGSGGFGISFKEITLEANQTYKQKLDVISGSISGQSIDSAFMSFKEDTWLSTTNYISYTPTENVNKNYMWIHANAVMNNLRLKIWGYKGTDNKPFEKFTNGASPNPSYEQPVKSAGENVNICPTDVDDWEQGTIANGSNQSSTTRLRIIEPKDIDENRQYTFSVQSGVIGNIWFYDENNDTVTNSYDMKGKTGVKTLSLTTPATTKYFRAVIKYANDSVITPEEIKTIKPKFERGTVATPWSPYGMGCVNEKISSKNLFNKDTALIKKYANKFDGTIGTSNGWSASDFIEVNPNTQYIYSGITNIWSDVAGAVFYDKNRAFISSVNSIVQSFTTPSNAKYVRLSIQTETPNNIQFEPGSTATSYVPHEEQNISIPTQQPMRSIGEVEDEFVLKNDGKWYERHWISRKIFDGTENWIYLDSRGNYYRFYLINFSSGAGIKPVVSNFFIDRGNSAIGEYNFVQSSGNEFYLQIENKTSVAELKAWLAEQYANETPVYVDYKLQTPTDILCTQAQSDILDSLTDTVHTYRGGTYITSPDEVKAKLSVSGLRNLNVLFNN